MEKDKFIKITIEEKPEDFFGWTLFSDPYGHIHLVPHQSRHIHAVSTACWCGPFYERKNHESGLENWYHHIVH